MRCWRLECGVNRVIRDVRVLARLSRNHVDVSRVERHLVSRRRMGEDYRYVVDDLPIGVPHFNS